MPEHRSNHVIIYEKVAPKPAIKKLRLTSRGDGGQGTFPPQSLLTPLRLVMSHKVYLESPL